MCWIHCFFFFLMTHLCAITHNLLRFIFLLGTFFYMIIHVPIPVYRNCNQNVHVQLRRFTLRGHQRLLEVRRLPARCAFWRQPIPKLVERRLRSRRVAIRSMQLGCPASSQRQRSAQSGRQREIGQSQVGNRFLFFIYILLFNEKYNTIRHTNKNRYCIYFYIM